MKPVSASGKSPAPQILTHGLLRVVFTWQADRWEHAIERIGDTERIGDPAPTATTARIGGMASREPGPSAAATTAWRSVSAVSGDDPRWPASPVLVEITAVTAPEGRSLAGLGLAGRSHFSASIGPDPEDAQALRFDLACRAAEPGWLGTTYAGDGAAWSVGPDADSGIVVEPLPGSNLESLAAGSGARGGGHRPHAARLLRIVPAAAATRFPATVRWAYRVRGTPSNSRPMAE